MRATRARIIRMVACFVLGCLTCGDVRAATRMDCATECRTRMHLRRCSVQSWGVPSVSAGRFGLRIDFNDRHGRDEPNPWQLEGVAEISAGAARQVMPVYPRRVFKGDSDHEHLVAYLPSSLRRAPTFTFRVTLRAPRRPDLVLEGRTDAGKWHLACACRTPECCLENSLDLPLEGNL